MLRAEDIVFSRKGYTCWLSNTKWSSLKMCIQVILYKLNTIYVCVLNVVACIYVFEKKDNRFEADQEGYERIWGLEKKIRRNIIIIL